MGLSALMAAITSAALLHTQIQQSERHENRRRQNKFSAIRALMPIYLDILWSYIDHNINAIQNFLDDDAYVSSDGKVSIDVMDIPSSTIEFLSSIIEFSDSDTNIISILIGLIQIQDARLKRYKSGIDLIDINENSLNEYIVQLYIMKQIVSDLYNYARRQSEHIPSSVKWDDVIRSMDFGGEELWSHDGALALARPRRDRQGEFVQFPF